MLQPLLQAARNNLPTAKPELWRNLPLALFRNVRRRCGAAEEFQTVSLNDGVQIRVDLRTGIGTSIYVYKTWEYPVTELVNAILHPEMCFFDIGANIGYYSLIAATRCYRVFAFEPAPKLFAKLQSNIVLNPTLNISALPIALSRNTGLASFYVVHDPQNQGLSSLHASADAEQITVPTQSLDDFVGEQKIPSVHLMKVDVEGAEEEVFQGGAIMLNAEIAPDIIFECHPGAKSDELLRDFGYRIYALRGQRDYEARNLFASKRALPGSVAALLVEEATRV